MKPRKAERQSLTSDKRDDGVVGRSAPSIGQMLDSIHVSDDTGSVVMFRQDAELRYLEIQSTQHGSSLQHMIGKADWELMPEAAAAKLTQAKQNVLNTGKGLRLEVSLTETGGRRHYDLMLGPILDARGNVAGIAGFALDVTGRHARENQRRQEMEELDVIARSLGAGIAIISHDYKTVWANDVIKGLYGDPTGRHCYLAYNGRSEVCPNCGVREVFEHGAKRIVHEQNGIDAGGKEIWSEIVASPMYNASGEITGAVEVVIPVTEKKRAEKIIRESESKWRTLFDAVRDAILVTDPESGLILDANEQATKLFDRPKEELIGAVRNSLYPEEYAGYVDPLIASNESSINGAGINAELLAADGSTRHVEISGGMVDLETGRRVLLEVHKDNSERTHAERQLAAQLQFLQQLLDAIPNPIFFKDINGRFTGLNSAYQRLTGHSREELLGQDCSFVNRPDIAALHGERDRELLENPGARVYESSMVAAEGVVRDFQFHKAALRNSEGGVDGIVAVMIDITETKQIMNSLRESEMRFRNVFEHSADPAFLMTDTLDDCNQKACDMLGYSRMDIIGHSIVEFSPDRQADGRSSKLSAAEYLGDALEGKSQLFEWQLVTMDGRVLDTEVSLCAITIRGHAVLHGIVRDITGRKRAEEKLNRLVTAVSQSAEGIVITDTGGTIEYVNPAFERITGYASQDVLGKTPSILKSGRHNAQFYDSMWSTLHSGETWIGQIVNKRKDGSLYTEQQTISPVVGTDGKIAQYVGVKRDVSRQVALEQMLTQSQKMEAIGRLAGGVAHDFNNLLTVITGYAEIVSAKLAESELMKDEIGEIRKAAARATALTRQLLAFSRRQITQPVQLNLGVIVTDLTKMLKRLIGEDIELDVRLSSEPTWIKADPVQIEQILMNLCVNSRDAMPNGGRLVLMSSRRTVENERSVGKNILKPGNYVIFEVTDTGVGMSEETLSHIFEPFFTTKEIGKGTGLGLATVFGVVEECGGVIEVQSEMGRGTSMYVYFPESVTGNVVPQGPRNGMSSRSRGESVLLVEDDNVVRKLVGHMLVELGYAVTACSNALEAIDHLARSKSNPMDVLLTDVIMPKMSGIELAERTLEFSPQTHIVLMSGYAQKKVTDEFLKKHNVGFISKPFDREVLGQKLREVLNRSNSKCAHEAKLL